MILQGVTNQHGGDGQEAESRESIHAREAFLTAVRLGGYIVRS
jgi:hypothetical protein